jgi:hypothetical protein
MVCGDDELDSFRQVSGCPPIVKSVGLGKLGPMSWLIGSGSCWRLVDLNKCEDWSCGKAFSEIIVLLWECCLIDAQLVIPHFVDDISRELRPIDLEVRSTFARHFMYPIGKLVGEGASTASFHTAATFVPSLVVWPMLIPGGAHELDASKELYRLAYEWAQAALRPTPAELASRFVANWRTTPIASGSSRRCAVVGRSPRKTGRTLHCGGMNPHVLPVGEVLVRHDHAP